MVHLSYSSSRVLSDFSLAMLLIAEEPGILLRRSFQHAIIEAILVGGLSQNLGKDLNGAKISSLLDSR